MSSETQSAESKMRSNEYWDRYLAAGRAETSVQDLFELALDMDQSIRVRVAQNPAAPPQLMLLLLNDPAAEVRTGLAENPKVPFFILEKLVIDEDIQVRFDMAENGHMPEIILRRLLDDDNPYVAVRASRTMNALYPKQSELVFMPSVFAPALVPA